MSQQAEAYFDYLKQTDFPRYVSEMGINPSELIAEAKVFYEQGYALTSQKKEEEAIRAYTQSITIFPLFTEALDNRAFLYMDRADWEPAIKDFRQSLAIEETFLAQFSLAECLCKSRQFALAKEELEKAKTLGEDPHVAILEAKITQGLELTQ